MNVEAKSVMIYEATRMPDLATVEADLKEIRAFQAKVKALMNQGHDYGTIPGTEKPTLLKPGAEKITKLFKCRPEFEEIEKIEDFDKPFFFYKFKCRLIHKPTDTIVDEGYGSCNSMEAKYAWRWVFDVPEHLLAPSLVSRKGFSKKTGKPYTQWRIPNDDLYTQANTILKMAKKRSLVDAALSLGSLSDIFTQDLEDIIEHESTPESHTNVEEEPEGDGQIVEHKASDKQINYIKGMVEKKLKGEWDELCIQFDAKDKDSLLNDLGVSKAKKVIDFLLALKA